MQKTINWLVAVVLTTGIVFAQNASGNIEDIFDELMADTQEAAPVDEKPAEDSAASFLKSIENQTPDSKKEQADTAEPAVSQKPASTKKVDVDAMVKESRKQMVGGEYDKALQGFAEIVKIAPENKMARMYLRTLLERDHKTAEIDAMNEVNAAWSTDMVLRSYQLADGAAERMKLKGTTSSVDVETLFPKVEFPKDSSAIYQPKHNSIFIRNTPENLAVMEAMMDTMGVLKESVAKAKQVEIEAKFVEVSEGTLEELGFQWNFNDSTSVGVGGFDLDVDDGSRGLFSEALRGSPTSSDPSLPFSQNSALGTASGDWSSFRMADTFSSSTGGGETDSALTLNGGTFDMVISALDQSTGTDVLSAPRIVTRSGEEATLRVGELHSYPEVYESDTAAQSMLNVVYEDFSEKLLGVELTVIPKVGDDQTITMHLNPRITELAGWQSYQLAPADSVYTYRQHYAGVEFTHEAVVARLPVFKKREIETEVVMLDGGTIGMGGLINEKIESFEDKVPVLGSLPLVGRLFRNEGERAIKRNLLMFVTAKIVEPNGRINTSRSFE